MHCLFRSLPTNRVIKVTSTAFCIMSVCHTGKCDVACILWEAKKNKRISDKNSYDTLKLSSALNIQCVFCCLHSNNLKESKLHKVGKRIEIFIYPNRI